MGMRIITRADFDGLVSATLIRQFEDVDAYLFVEPNLMQERLVKVTNRDIIANLSHHPACALWFDHHISNQLPRRVPGYFRIAPSAARVAAEYYGIARCGPWLDLLEHCDRIDAARFTRDEILNPDDYFYLAMSIDGKQEEDYPYWLRLMDLLEADYHAGIFRDAEVVRRLQLLREQEAAYRELIRRRSSRRGRVALTDLRNLETVPAGSRFYIYALFPDTLTSLRISDHDARRVRISLGHNILRRDSKVNLGLLLARYGGGGHFGAGSCRVPRNEAEAVTEELLTVLNRNEPLGDPPPNSQDSHASGGTP
jgi:hypothetical protein